MAASAILDLLGKFSDHPQRRLCGLYNCAKFGWNRYSIFECQTRKIFKLSYQKFEYFASFFFLKMLIHAPFGVFLG